jgi:drug/metabolite transporter (DMT)-like permease
MHAGGGPLWVWLSLSEQPSRATLLGGSVVIAGVALRAGDAPAAEQLSDPRRGTGGCTP